MNAAKNKIVHIAACVVVLIMGFALFKAATIYSKVSAVRDENVPFVFLVVDISDPVERYETKRIRAEIVGRLNQKVTGAAIYLVRMNERAPLDPYIVFEKIIPPPVSSEEQIALTPIDIENRKSAREDAIADFATSLDKLLSEQVNNPSPIMETLVAISNRYEMVMGRNVELHVYSDMFQNSVRAKMDPRVTTAAECIDEYAKLNGVDVFLHVLERRSPKGKRIPIPSHVKRAWDVWLDQSRGRVIWSE